MGMEYADGPKASILRVEDDLGTVQVLTELLEGAGYRVVHVETGAEARVMLGRLRPNLIILDITLPDADGLLLSSKLKAIANVPIIICSGAAQKRDRVLALKLGADDFIGKPFDVDEFEARVEAVLRRAGHPPGAESAADQLRVGELVIDLSRRRVTLGEQPLALTPTEFRLLAALASRPGGDLLSGGAVPACVGLGGREPQSHD